MDENKYLITQMQEHLTKLDGEHEHKRTSFWATDCEKPLFDLYHSWVGTKPTNPIEAEKLTMFSAAKMTEKALVETLDQMGLLQGVPEEQLRIEMTRNGVPISGYLDGRFKEGYPLEVKTYYGMYQAKELREGKPRSSYLKQLAVYMDALNEDKGKLIYMDRGTGEMHEFTLLRTGKSVFKCLAVEFDLEDVYKRWSDLYFDHVLPQEEPKSEFRYKIPVLELDWKTVSKGDISKARNNKKVIGDSWQVAYSPYKNLIIEREKTCLGYSDTELEQIKTLTQGFTNWR